MSQTVIQLVLFIPVFLFSLCLHELAHGVVAWRLGDPTAKMAGRLTLSPMAHADMMGTIVLPALCVLSGFPFVGWAKPVPVDVRYFKHPRWYMALVAFAGPASNLLLAGIATALLAGAIRIPNLAIGGLEFGGPAQLILLVTMQANLMLAFLNLLPIPPLDGFNILQFFIPLRAAGFFYKLTPVLSIGLLALMVFGGLKYLAVPVQWAFRYLLGLIA